MEKIYRIKWILKKAIDPSQMEHFGPPLFKVELLRSELSLRRRPFTLEEAKELCASANKNFTRGTHEVCEFLSNLEEEKESE